MEKPLSWLATDDSEWFALIPAGQGPAAPVPSIMPAGRFKALEATGRRGARARDQQGTYYLRLAWVELGAGDL